MSATDKFPFSIFSEPPDVLPIMWLQNPRDVMDGNNYRAPEEKRIYIKLEKGKRSFDPLCDAALELMERELGGHPDRHDPLPSRWIITNSKEDVVHVIHGSVYGLEKRGLVMTKGYRFNSVSQIFQEWALQELA